MKLNELKHPVSTLPTELDGFSVLIDAERQRADIVLNRPPLNVI